MLSPEAIVRYDGTTWTVPPGRALVIGRGASADIQVGRRPVDTRVSREHASLSLAGGLVTVTRLSRSQLVLIRSASSTFSLDAVGESATRSGDFSVLIPRTEPQGHFRFDVHAGPGLPAPSPGTDRRGGTTPTPRLLDRDRVLLATYARPMLAGDDRAATHQEAAANLNYGYEWCRERIDGLRKRLAADGWGVGPDKESLCRWAVAMRIVTEADLHG